MQIPDKPPTDGAFNASEFNQVEVAQFNRDGFVIAPKLLDGAICRQMAETINASLNPPTAPLEFETDVQYPGSPLDRDAPGGDTARRLLHAYARDNLFRQCAHSAAIVGRVKQLMAATNISLSQNHHNCIMTKHPGFSSATQWHQDIRYWTFDRPELISVWLALGDETPTNGGLQLLAGTHDLELDRGRYDAAYFLRTDLAENQSLIDHAIPANLHTGDVLFFHCRTFHAAGRNQTDSVKLSLVFTYHADDNQPIAETRSSRYPDIPC